MTGLLLRRRPVWAAGVTIAAAAWSLFVSLRLLAWVAASPGGGLALTRPWVAAGRVRLSVGLLLDPLSAVMLVVVAAVSLLVQVYSTRYLAGDPGYGRYFAYLSLFAAAMFGLVLAPDLFQMYMFYELVGLASFLLIGFWHEEPGPLAAARKAFVTTRLGDFGLLLGILLLYWHARTLDFRALAKLAPQLNPAVTGLAALLVFAGAAGKSAQFPLHVWLPDAMAGPTPVSALIHAATMVASGVYLMARAYPLFLPEVSGPAPLAVVASLGALTSLLGAGAALAQTDLKRALAYSTVSQLGLMMLGLGSLGRTAALFHLVTHAFFKALLFLGAGAVILRSHHEQDIRRLGGLAWPMPVTAAAFAVGALALAGVPPFSGFYSKDAILLAVQARAGESALYAALLVVGLLTSALTAFYAGRLFFLVFGGREAVVSGPEARPAVREAPAALTAPLILLAIPAAALGYFGEDVVAAEEHAGSALPALTAVLALAGLGAAWLLYGRRRPAEDPLEAALGPVHRVLRHGFYLDELYTRLGDLVVRRLAAALHWVDRKVVDRAVNGTAGTVLAAGQTLRLVQNGWVQRYVLYMAGGVVLAVLVWLWRGFGPPGSGGVSGW